MPLPKRPSPMTRTGRSWSAALANGWPFFGVSDESGALAERDGGSEGEEADASDEHEETDP